MSLLKRIFGNYINGHGGSRGGHGGHGGAYRNKHHGRQSDNLYSNNTPAFKVCPNCQTNNPAQARFCGQCGKDTIQATCACGAAIIPGSKFCGQCGASL